MTRIDEYLDMLRDNPAAPPPPGLDPQLAALARELVEAERLPYPDETTLKRIWARTLREAQRDANAARFSPNGHKQEEWKMELVQTWPGARRRGALNLLGIAAVIMGALFSGFFLFSFMLGDDDTNNALTVYIPEDSNKALVQRFIEECWNEGNLGALDELLTEDFVRHEPGMPDIPRAALPDYITGFRTAFPDGLNEITTINAEGDRVWVMGTFTGTFSAPLALGETLVAEPTGEVVTFQVMTTARIANGRIAEQWVLTDSLALMTQVGAVSAPDAHMVEQRNLAVARAVVDELWNEFNLERIEDYYAEVTRFHSPAGDGTWLVTPIWTKGEGAYGYADLNRGFHEAFPDGHYTLLQLTADADTVIAHYAFEGTHEKSYGTPGEHLVEASGTVEKFDAVTVFRFEDGKIVEEWLYWDNEPALAADACP